MTTFQIRHMPQPLYEQLAQRAMRFHRSLTQQAIADLSQTLDGDMKARRLVVLRKIRAAHASEPVANATDTHVLAMWLREDRDR